MNSGPLEEQPVLLTTEPSLQPAFFLFLRQGLYLALAALNSVEQAGLELTEIYLCLLTAGIKGVCYHTWVDVHTHAPAHTPPTSQEAEAGQYLSSKPFWCTQQVLGQPELHMETLSQ